MLERDPLKRLGSGVKDWEEIRAHEFFKDMDFEKLHRKEIKPPYKPKTAAEYMKEARNKFPGLRHAETLEE